MNLDPSRPDADALLAHIASEETEQRRGRLKVFLGATAGVGKTYAMLEAAHARAREGVGVVVGVVETHGRRETQTLLEGLEILPRRRVDHRGVALEEFDLDAALARRPALILVDELAHTNAPGTRHAKRWQDVEELLASGISVLTTVNVQHLESLNDVVARITHVVVRETVPDKVLENAHEVELVDLPPAELLQRLEEGKVYVPEQARRARESFFRLGNLIALRQLALRYTAEHVDADMRIYRRAHAVTETWPVAERLLVGVGPAPSSRQLVRAAKRMADRLGAPWMAVFVETPEYASFPEADRQRVWETLRLARELGAETATVSGAGTATLVEHARRSNVTRILVGKPTHPPWRDRLFGSRVDRIVRASGDIDVYVVSADVEREAIPRRRGGPAVHSVGREYAAVTLLLAGLTAGAAQFRPDLEIANLIMLYLLAVLGFATWLGRGPAALASVLSVAALDWFFVPPYGTFNVADTRFFPVFGVMLVASLVIGGLTARVRLQAASARRREERTAALFAVTRDLVGVEEAGVIDEAVARHFQETFGLDARVLAPDPFGVLRVRSGGGARPASDPPVADWVLSHGRPAGPGTDTLPQAAAVYLPVSVRDGPARAVLELPAAAAAAFRDPERLQLAETFARLAGSALEQAHLAAASRRANQLVEMNRLKAEFVEVAARELAGPLERLAGALTAVTEAPNPTPTSPAVADALREPRESVARLLELVMDLLDLSGLQSRKIRLDLDDVPTGPLLARCVADARELVGALAPTVALELEADVPAVRADPERASRALRDLVVHALRRAGPSGRVVASADALGDFVVFSVADDGPVIPIDAQERVFEPLTESVGGGLGLALAREIVDAHRGEIWVDSGPGPGAVLSFTLPTTAPGTAERCPR
jgi:two-component system sensor histidine kinase KdpD